MVLVVGRQIPKNGKSDHVTVMFKHVTINNIISYYKFRVTKK
jgi:hypothetical protein